MKKAKVSKKDWIMLSTLVPKALRLKLKSLAKRKKMKLGDLLVKTLSGAR